MARFNAVASTFVRMGRALGRPADRFDAERKRTFSNM
jgi:hypothetical protein